MKNLAILVLTAMSTGYFGCNSKPIMHIQNNFSSPTDSIRIVVYINQKSVFNDYINGAKTEYDRHKINGLNRKEDKFRIKVFLPEYNYTTVDTILSCSNFTIFVSKLINPTFNGKVPIDSKSIFIPAVYYAFHCN